MSSWRMEARIRNGWKDWGPIYGNGKEGIRMKNYTDEELVEIADWAESNERETLNQEVRKAYGAMRQGADWLIRFRIKERKAALVNAGNKQVGSGKPTTQ